MNSLHLFITLLLISNTAHAYIGPGLGIGLVVSIIGLILSVFIFLFAIIWFPIKRILNKKKKKKY